MRCALWRRRFVIYLLPLRRRAGPAGHALNVLLRAVKSQASESVRRLTGHAALIKPVLVRSTYELPLFASA